MSKMAGYGCYNISYPLEPDTEVLGLQPFRTSSRARPARYSSNTDSSASSTDTA